MGDGSSSFWYDSWTREGPLCRFVDYVHISNTQLRINDCWHEGRWCLNSLSTIVNEHIRKLVEEVLVPFVISHPDTITWLLSPTGIYTASTGYSLFLVIFLRMLMVFYVGCEDYMLLLKFPF